MFADPGAREYRVETGRVALNGILFALLTILCAFAAPDLGANEPEAFTVVPFDDKVMIAGNVYQSNIPAENPTDIIGRSTDRFFEEVLAEVKDGYDQASARGLAWSRAEDSGVVITSSSQLTLIAFDVINTLPQSEFMLEIFGPAAVAWYVVDSQGSAVLHVDDFSKPNIGRPVFDPKAVMPLTLRPYERYRVFVCAYLLTQEGLVTLTLWEPEAFRVQRTEQNIVDGVYFGLAFAIVLASLGLGIMLRKSIYVLFALFVASTSGLILVGSGLSSLYLLAERPALAVPYFFLTFALAGLFSGLFSMKLLDMANTYRPLYYFYAGFAIYTCVAATFTLWLTTREVITVESVGIIFVIGSAGSFVAQLGHAWALVYYARKSPIAILWYVGVFVHSWAMITWIFLIGSSVQTDLDRRYLVQFAMVFDALLLLALILYNYREEQRARVGAQQRSLENLRMAHDLERSKSNFVATVGHDLRGPVQAISHFVQSLKPDVPQESTFVLRKIDENVATISDLLDAMVKLSEIEWQGAAPARGPVRIESMLAELRSEFSAKADEKGLSLEFDASPCIAYSDKVCLGQVLRNLIDNAIKYTEFGQVRVYAKDQVGSVCIAVVDTGRGIRGSELEHVFEEFYRSTETGADVSGMGLGLAIVARLTKLLEIEVTVSSKVGIGSRFELKIPKAASDDSEDAEAQAAVKLTNSSLDGMSVLVVSKKHDTTMAILAQLQAWGAQVLRVGSFEEANRSGQMTSVDLVLTDINAYTSGRPETIGLEFPILIVTPGSGLQHDTRALGENHVFVESDIRPMRLRSIVQRTMQGAIP